MNYEDVDRITAAYKRLEDHLQARFGKLQGFSVGRLMYRRYGGKMRLCFTEAERPLLDCGIADRVSITVDEIKLFLAECERAQNALEERAAVRANELETFMRTL
jgi:hypothetical protein